MYTDLHVEYPLFLSDFNGTSNFSTDFRKKKKLNIKFNEHPTCRGRSSSMRADGLTERQDEANSRYSQVCERAKNQ